MARDESSQSTDSHQNAACADKTVCPPGSKSLPRRRVRLLFLTLTAVVALALATYLLIRLMNPHGNQEATHAEIAAIRDLIEEALAQEDLQTAETRLYEFQFAVERLQGDNWQSLRWDVDLYAYRILAQTPGVYWHMVYSDLCGLEERMTSPDERQQVIAAAIRLMALEAVDDNALAQEINLKSLERLSRPSKYLTARENEHVALARQQFLQRVSQTAVDDMCMERLIEIFGESEVQNQFGNIPPSQK